MQDTFYIHLKGLFVKIINFISHMHDKTTCVMSVLASEVHFVLNVNSC